MYQTAQEYQAESSAPVEGDPEWVHARARHAEKHPLHLVKRDSTFCGHLFCSSCARYIL